MRKLLHGLKIISERFADYLMVVRVATCQPAKLFCAAQELLLVGLHSFAVFFKLMLAHFFLSFFNQTTHDLSPFV